MTIRMMIKIRRARIGIKKGQQRGCSGQGEGTGTYWISVRTTGAGTGTGTSASFSPVFTIGTGTGTGAGRAAGLGAGTGAAETGIGTGLGAGGGLGFGADSGTGLSAAGRAGSISISTKVRPFPGISKAFPSSREISAILSALMGILALTTASSKRLFVKLVTFTLVLKDRLEWPMVKPSFEELYEAFPVWVWVKEKTGKSRKKARTGPKRCI
jgi:hypothetical protein